MLVMVQASAVGVRARKFYQARNMSGPRAPSGHHPAVGVGFGPGVYGLRSRV